jgi:hypothetical protein
MAREEQAAGAAIPEIPTRPQMSPIGDIDKYSVERLLDRLQSAEQASTGT